MAITSAIMQMRRGLEADFDPDKMKPGEWAVSTDEKYVRMCFSHGVCVRMATYDAFEKDMEEIQAILKECQTIEEAVNAINTQVSSNAQAVAENTAKAKSYMETASSKANEASGYAQTASDKASESLQNAESASISMETATQKANSASQSANIATEKANEAIEAANSAIESAGNADLSESNAKKSEDNAYDYSNISKSYAVGETGERLGEETDNSKYYSDLAKTEAERAKSEADRAQGLVGGDFVTNSQIKEYSLIKDTGYELGLSIDNSTYVMTVQLKNANGSVLSEKSIDFPIESMVINATYSNGVITLTLQNGTTLPVNVSALISGLVKDTFTIAGIDMKDNITATELKKALSLNNVANVTVNNQAPTFTQASARKNIASGEKLSVLFGKIMKWFADLKAVAFSGSYSDLINKPTTLDTYEEIMANTVSGRIAGANGVKEGFNFLNDSLNALIVNIGANYTGDVAPAVTIQPNSYAIFTIPLNVPQGYKPIIFSRIEVANAIAFVVGHRIDSANNIAYIAIGNQFNTEINTFPVVEVICMKSQFVGW